MRTDCSLWDGYASADRRFLRAVGRDAESPVPAQIRPSSGLDDAVNHEPPRGAVAPSGMPLWSNDPQMWPSASSARCADECVCGVLIAPLARCGSGDRRRARGREDLARRGCVQPSRGLARR